MIRLDHVDRSYQRGTETVHALRDVSETIEDGEHVAIVGPSGSGKTTLLNVIGCLDRPQSGEVWLDELEMTGLDEEGRADVRRQRIGFVFQSYHLVSRLDAIGNVALPLLFAGVPRRERLRRASKALCDVGLGPRLHHRPGELSGGECQRVAIARAIVNEPKVLLADEPTGNLDRASGRRVLDLLDQLNQDGITLLVVTHDPQVARRAERVMVLVDGQVVERRRGDEALGLALFREAEP